MCSSRWSRARAVISAPAPTFPSSTRSIATRGDPRLFATPIQDGLRALIDLDRPTIAVLRGNAVGGGLGLALACDLRFCAADAYLAVDPGQARPRLRPCRDAAARRTRRSVAGQGSPVHRPADRDRGGARDRPDRPADRDGARGDRARLRRGLAELSQTSIRGAKRAIDAIAAGMAVETPAFRALTEAAALGPDFAEGRAAFAEKRTPRFSFRGATQPLPQA